MNLTDHKNIDFKNKTIMIRTDYNVPINDVYNNISDHTRIDMTIPTLKEIILKKPKLIIIVSHLGRPDPSIYNASLSLLPIKNYLSLKLNKKIHFLTDYFPNTDLSNFTGIVMLENIRFIKDEENYKPNNELSQYLSKYIDIYMNEAFSCCHRSHTSIVGVNSKYKIAGKTGTSQKLKNGKYVKDYSTSFVGYFPADNPKYSCIVVVDSPKGFRKEGSNVAAPVFKEIADKYPNLTQNVGDYASSGTLLRYYRMGQDTSASAISIEDMSGNGGAPMEGINSPTTSTTKPY